ncbi:quinone oxidoreductase-like protein 1 isoform X1 [Onychostruthus taczanowskii]|uniref:quinone oxidoreductase-like protein 1 isoform X1 n=1 Tax=Onychostruthus taczanowskii TaxID=356909 RepID=UPI001B808457|nr:quinone oxidoreductase-like protein 1 isoform X1 [Onychostruthus taczanowskii]XP_041258102.1 quinone oxidoreductase-like protein 1 isoform X1 [Onychostruthus taczanowskii]XP_041258103.1 quinone oxidoreductase-like protein 1 isoform X1 [Onychostruthus taczanowskii]XP_041258104.1 quinone oxidoreductase-like protein 1 isoform X1 [Onychostruthus taczanowskii]XP_041258105.1 quinone oxidoreductase-like protein 1 isoform X1 [Onychostruthus taczanowskii]XP_041258107.1 quinone oxidoreductase-like pr
MKALYAQQNSPGEEITFVFQERENLPACRAHDVKVQVRACALSWLDTKLLSEIQLKKELVPVGREISGVVLEVGSKVTFFQPDDEVVGILPLDSEESGVCEVILVHEHYLVQKPQKVCWAEAAGTLRDGLRAYTALHYLAHVSPGTSVLVLDGASPFGTIAIQLAQHRGAKVISTAHSLEDKQYLERLRPAGGVWQPLVARVMDVSHGKIDVAESCLEETGGLGVDVVLDAGVRLYSAEDEAASKCQLLPHKHDIITLLGVGGRWITTERNLQLDPPDSHSLFLKGATVSFLNDEVWNLSSVQQGKYLAILEDIMEKLSNGIFRPQLDEPIPLYEAKVTMEIVQKNQARKRQVIQF